MDCSKPVVVVATADFIMVLARGKATAALTVASICALAVVGAHVPGAPEDPHARAVRLVGQVSALHVAN